MDPFCGKDDSEYYRAYCRFGQKKTFIYFESQEDFPFWDRVLNRNVPDIKYEKGSLSKESSEKSHSIFKEKSKNANEFYLFFENSKYSYVLRENTDDFGEADKNQPYIFQTYSYSTINYKCFSESLRQLCVAVSKTPVCFDFDKFVSDFSKTIYPLYLYALVFFKKHGATDQNKFPLKDFYNIIKLEERINIENNGDEIINNLVGVKVFEKIKELKTENRNGEL